MKTMIKEKFLDWFSSLTERDKKIIVIFISLLLPSISIYFYFRENSNRWKIEQKIANLPSIGQLRERSINVEKQIIYYKEQIPRLNAMLLNPNIEYTYNIQPNQIPIILSSITNRVNGKIVLLKEGLPKNIIINQNNQLMPKNIKEKNVKIFQIEAIPTDLSIMIPQNNINKFFSLLNKPNTSSPFILINSVAFGFGKSQCTNNPLQNELYTHHQPIMICLKTYVISNIRLLSTNIRSKKYAKKK